jgi:hypothetical protein
LNACTTFHEIWCGNNVMWRFQRLISQIPPFQVQQASEWPTCRVDPVWTPPPTMQIKKKISPFGHTRKWLFRFLMCKPQAWCYLNTHLMHIMLIRVFYWTSFTYVVKN